MREIKFRAWDTYGKSMIEPDMFLELTGVKTFARKPRPIKRERKVREVKLVKKATGLFGLDEYAEAENIRTDLVEMESKYFEANPFTDPDLIVMQYTGLKDKHGVEIYEGDVVRYDAGNEYVDAVIEWSTGGYWFKWQDGAKPQDFTSFWYQDEVNTEVIGNIYENPELLQEAK